LWRHFPDIARNVLASPATPSPSKAKASTFYERTTTLAFSVGNNFVRANAVAIPTFSFSYGKPAGVIGR
jgi:hypothetical protein